MPREPRHLAPWIAAGVAIVGGLIWAICFGRHGFLFLPWVALTPLILLVDQRRAPLWGFLHGLATWLLAIPWIGPTISTYGELPGWLGGLVLVLLSSYLALYHCLFAWLARAMWTRGSLSLSLVGLPALWTSLEVLRQYLVTGFPWNLASYAWVEVPGALLLSSWIGAFGVSFVVLVPSVGLAQGITRRRWEPAAVGFLVPLLLLALAVRFAKPQSPDSPAREVRLIQPNVPILMASQTEEQGRHYRRLLQLSDEACDQPALLVWPESAAWPYAFSRDARLQEDVRRLTDGGCSLLLNSPRWQGEEVFNTAFLAQPGGALEIYDKRHLVPFGEYVPFAGVLPFVGNLARNAGSFSASEDARLLSWQGERIGMAICFEIIFPHEVAALVANGATLIATITNDGWYGDTWAPWQHLRAARFRAAENRRPVLRAALTGITALIASDGQTLHAVGIDREGIVRATVVGTGQLSPYTRMPWLAPFLCLAIASFAILSTRRGP